MEFGCTSVVSRRVSCIVQRARTSAIAKPRATQILKEKVLFGTGRGTGLDDAGDEAQGEGGSGCCSSRATTQRIKIVWAKIRQAPNVDPTWGRMMAATLVAAVTR